MKQWMYVWERPIRVVHWLNFICITALSITGLYIAFPFIKPNPNVHFLMSWFRFIHFVFAYIFIFTFLVRIYWWFAGNQYANWRSYFPFGKKDREKLVKQLMFYSLMSKRPPSVIGHAPLAGITYLIIFLINLFSMLTGFALYSLYYPGGFMYSTFAWMFSIIPLPHMRLYHHIVMWLMLYFLMVHVYIILFINTVEKNHILYSMVDGYLIVDTEELE